MNDSVEQLVVLQAELSVQDLLKPMPFFSLARVLATNLEYPLIDNREVLEVLVFLIEQLRL